MDQKKTFGEVKIQLARAKIGEGHQRFGRGSKDKDDQYELMNLGINLGNFLKVFGDIICNFFKAKLDGLEDTGLGRYGRKSANQLRQQPNGHS